MAITRNILKSLPNNLARDLSGYDSGVVAPILPWILETGLWNDAGVWDDSDVWNDGVEWILNTGFWDDSGVWKDSDIWND